jgi:diguanylate cyclase (GGDEF)-like protein
LRATRATYDLTRWNGVGTLPSYIIYVTLAGGRWSLGTVLIGVSLGVLAAAEVLVGWHFRPESGRDLRVWSRWSRRIFTPSTALWGLSMVLVVPEGETLRSSGVLLPLVVLVMADAVYGMYERAVYLRLSVPLVLASIVGFQLLQDEDAGILTISTLVLFGISTSLNIGLIRHTRRAIDVEIERERLLVMLSDEHAELDRRIRRDVLTDAPNRLAFVEAVNATHADRRPIALLLIDLDGFKSVNDNFGHGVGDRVLVEVVRRLNAAVGSAERVFRLGGDEFAVLLLDPSSARSTGDLILESMRPTFVVGGANCVIGASVGVALSDGVLDTDVLLTRADRAMYASKAGGRQRVTFYCDELSQDIVNADENAGRSYRST